MGWGGVGGSNNVHVSCWTCDAMLMLRAWWGGVGWAGVAGCNNVHVSFLTCDATLMLPTLVGWGGMGWGHVRCSPVHVLCFQHPLRNS